MRSETLERIFEHIKIMVDLSSPSKQLLPENQTKELHRLKYCRTNDLSINLHSTIIIRLCDSLTFCNHSRGQGLHVVSAAWRRAAAWQHSIGSLRKDQFPDQSGNRTGSDKQAVSIHFQLHCLNGGYGTTYVFAELLKKQCSVHLYARTKQMGFEQPGMANFDPFSGYRDEQPTGYEVSKTFDVTLLTAHYSLPCFDCNY